MEIKIKDKKITLKYGFRAMMIYEEITDKTFGVDGKTGIKELITMFYSIALASDSELPLKYDEFIEWCDENPDEFGRFCQWFIEVNAERLPRKESEVEPELKKTTTKKNNQKLKKA